MDGPGALAALLKTCFNFSELQRFVQDDLEQRELMEAIPRERVSLNDLASSVTDGLVARGLVTSALFAKLRESRPNRKDDIYQVEQLFARGKQGILPPGRWPRWLHRSLLAGVFLGGVATLLGGVWWLHRYIVRSALTDTDNVVFGDLVHQGKDWFVSIKDGNALMAQNGQINDELVLLPARLTGLRLTDICHLAILIQRPPDGELLAHGISRLRILDMHFDGKVCNVPLEEFLSKRWGITGDVSGFPSTHLRRADQYNREAEKAERRLSERSLTMALESYRTAVQLYSSNEAFRLQSPSRVQQRIGELRQTIYAQRLRINQATDRPLHEMVPIKAGFSYSWHPDERQRRRLYLDAFWIDRFEVSNAQYEQYNPAHFRGRAIEDRFPVVLVSWHKAQYYCRQRGLRLPTADEYERVATWRWRDQAPRPYPWEPAVLKTEHLARLKLLHGVQDDPNGQSQDGVMNLVGNVAEWTIRKHSLESSNDYVIKGGSFMSQQAGAFNPERSETSADIELPHVGFRCACSMRPENDNILVNESANY